MAVVWLGIGGTSGAVSIEHCSGYRGNTTSVTRSKSLVTIEVVTLATPSCRIDGTLGRMRDTREVWVCELDGCGHVWLASSKLPPDRCAKCKRRAWHVTKTTGELIREKAPEITLDLEERIRRIVREEWVARPNGVTNGPPTRYNVAEPEILPPAARPSLDSLRDICAGLTTPLPIEPADRPACDFTQYDPDTGETYQCGLSAHPAKVKHTRGPKVTTDPTSRIA